MPNLGREREIERDRERQRASQNVKAQANTSKLKRQSESSNNHARTRLRQIKTAIVDSELDGIIQLYFFIWLFEGAMNTCWAGAVMQVLSA